MYKNLVFSGGGINCLCYIGVLKYIEENGIRSHIERTIGSSGGALFLLTIILGYSFKDVHQIILGLDITLIRDITTDSILSFFDTYGFDTGNRLEHLIKLLIGKKVEKSDITFSELYKIIPIEFTVTGLCMNTQETEYFNYKTTPDMPVYVAVRISCSIPFIYNMVTYNGKNYIDGGMMDNYPIDYFDGDICNTLGFCIRSGPESCQINGLDEFIYSIITSLNRKLEKNNLKRYAQSSILIRSGLGMTQFSLSETLKKECVQNGYDTTKEFFEKKIIQDIVYGIVDDVIEISQKKDDWVALECQHCQYTGCKITQSECNCTISV